MKLVLRYRVKSLNGLLNRQARTANFVRNMLKYKSTATGAWYEEVDERFTFQTCSNCGALPDSRPNGIAGLGVREFTCSDCGVVHNRDLNVAKNILRRGRATLSVGIPDLSGRGGRQMLYLVMARMRRS